MDCFGEKTFSQAVDWGTASLGRGKRKSRKTAVSKRDGGKNMYLGGWVESPADFSREASKLLRA